MPKANASDTAGLAEGVASGAFGVSSLFGSFSGKVCLVTGGGSGIGAAITCGLVANGATVYIASRKDTSSFADALTSAAGSSGGRCISMRADLANDDGVVALAAELLAREKSLHLLVNNSGTNWAEDVSTYPMKAWDKVYALNVKAVFHLTRECLPLLEASGTKGDPARVVNISSIEGLIVPAHDTYAYSSGKAAVSHMTRVMAGKFEGRNITVNAILPGPFRSRMMAGTLKAAGEDLIASGTVLNRIGEPQDIAGTTLFLASKAGSYVNGATLTCDGGMTVKAKF